MTQPAPEPTTTPATQNPAGATPPAQPAAPAQPATPVTDGDKPLGPAGERALQAERDARKALEKQVADLAPLAQLVKGLGGGDADKGKTEIEALAERQKAMEKSLADERLARFKAEVANEKGLTAAQVERLRGSTREELLADADAFLSLFPAGTTPKGGTPAPDPSQGAGGTPIDIDARIAEAMKAGNVTLAVSLQNQKLSKAK